MFLNGRTATRVTDGGTTAVVELRVQTNSAATSRTSAVAAARNGTRRRRRRFAVASGAVACTGTAAARSSDSRNPCSSSPTLSISPGRIRVQCPLDHAHEAFGHVRPHITQRLTPAIRVCSQQLLHRRGDDRKLAGDEVEEQDADAIEIALDRGFLASEDLGRQIQRRPDEAAGAGEILASPEVHEDDAPACLAHDVLRLDVAVQQPGAVDRRERSADIQADECRLARTERSTIGDELLERLASDELRPETDATVMFLGAVDLHDVLVAETGQTPGLFHQARVRLAAAAASLVVMEQLQRDVAVEVGVPRAEHVAGCTCADEIEEDETPPSPPVRRDRCVGWRDVGRWDAAVQGSDAVDEAKMSNDAKVAVRSTSLNCLPIDRAAVRHRGSEICERAVVSPQVSNGPHASLSIEQ